MEIMELQPENMEEILNVFDENNQGDEHARKIFQEELEESIAKKIKSPTFLIAKENDKIIGYVGFSPSRINYRVYQIYFLLVDESHREKGIGKSLMVAAINEIKKARRHAKDDYLIFLTALKHEYYRKHFGFKTIEEIRANGSNVMVLRV